MRSNRNSARKARHLAPLLVAAIGVIGAWWQWQPAEARNCRAVDGDTLACGEDRVRIAGMDAPELRGRCEAEQRLAGAASVRLQALVAGGVTLRETGQDRYGRMLAVVRDRDGADVARILIREGLARPYDGRGRREGWC